MSTSNRSPLVCDAATSPHPAWRRQTVAFAVALLAACPCALASGPSTHPLGGPLADPLPDLPVGPHIVRLVDVVSELVFPTDVAAPPDGSPRLFVTEIGGRVQVLVDGVVQPAPFLDFSADYHPTNGSATSSLAFHPDFASNRKLYLITTEDEDPALADFGVTSGVAQQSVLYEVAAQADFPAAGANLLDPASKRELLRINEDSTIHNLGDLAFGPDGYLYLTKGDDETGGQDLTSIHGSVLRIDVDLLPGNAPGANGQYAIPADNPFVGAGGGVVEELWAYGFRNPWRLSFDGADAWVADVGEFDVEELDRAVAGGNHGWPWKEGAFAHVPGGGVSDDLSGLPPGPFVDPVGQYDHGQQDRSATGGVLYRGARFAELHGRYVFGDWVSGRLFELDPGNGAIRRLSLDPSGAAINGQQSGPPIEGVISIAADADGELLLVVTQRNDTPTGRVLRVERVRWADQGCALAGVTGEPLLEGSGSLAVGSSNLIALSNAAPSALAGFFLALTSTPAPFKGGTLKANPPLPPVFATTSPAGSLEIPFVMPPDVPSGTELWVQWGIQDAAAVLGVSLSNAVLGVTP